MEAWARWVALQVAAANFVMAVADLDTELPSIAYTAKEQANADIAMAQARTYMILTHLLLNAASSCRPWARTRWSVTSK